MMTMMTANYDDHTRFFMSKSFFLLYLPSCYQDLFWQPSQQAISSRSVQKQLAQVLLHSLLSPSVPVPLLQLRSLATAVEKD
jgi:hypothetical protein